MLKAYQTEWQKYPFEQRVKLSARMACLLTSLLAKHHDIKLLRIRADMRTTGHAWSHEISLPAEGCSLGMVIHELAHCYNYQRYNGRGHTGTFKNALALLYHHSRPHYKRMLLEVKARIEKEHKEFEEESRKMSIKIQNQMEREKREKETKASRAYRIKHIEGRIKNLESRKKRLETMIKTAKRSLVHLRRYENLSQQKQTPATESVKEA